jgi:hypothetical protein
MSLRSDASRACCPTSLSGTRRGKGGTPRRCPGLGTPTRRVDERRIEECYRTAPHVAAGHGTAATTPRKTRSDGQLDIGSPLNSPGRQAGFASAFSPSRVLWAASPARPTAGMRWLDNVFRSSASPSAANPKGPSQ